MVFKRTTIKKIRNMKDLKQYEKLLSNAKMELIIKGKDGNYYFLSKKNWRRKEKIKNIYERSKKLV